MAPMPRPPYTPHLTSRGFVCLFVSLDEKVLKGKCFADVEEVKQTTAEGLKGIKIEKFKTCLEQ